MQGPESIHRWCVRRPDGAVRHGALRHITAVTQPKMQYDDDRASSDSNSPVYCSRERTGVNELRSCGYALQGASVCTRRTVQGIMRWLNGQCEGAAYRLRVSADLVAVLREVQCREWTPRDVTSSVCEPAN